MGQWRADVEAHVKSLSPLNEMLVSEVHVNSSVIQNDINASILCRSQKGGSRVSMQVIAALIVSPPSKKKFDICCWSCLFNPALGYKSH